MFFERIARHLEHVSELARHQIAYAEAAGDLTPGELTPDEAVDEVLLRAYPRVRRRVGRAAAGAGAGRA